MTHSTTSAVGAEACSTSSSRTSSTAPFGADTGARPPGVRAAAPTARRPVEQVDITDFFSDATRELLQRSAKRALEWASIDLDTEHLLWAAVQCP
jgi:ATP-dependent Clp protease ATP-binding subunit ClpC